MLCCEILSFFHRLMDDNASRKFNPKDYENKSTDDKIKEKEINHKEQQKMLEECNKVLEPLWRELDNCLEVFGYIPKDILAAEMETKEKDAKDKEKDTNEKDKDVNEKEKPKKKLTPGKDKKKRKKR